jgi:hypothetical protein
MKARGPEKRRCPKSDRQVASHGVESGRAVSDHEMLDSRHSLNAKTVGL